VSDDAERRLGTGPCVRSGRLARLCAEGVRWGVASCLGWRAKECYNDVAVNDPVFLYYFSPEPLHPRIDPRRDIQIGAVIS
jgi:hypothetical protein